MAQRGMDAVIEKSQAAAKGRKPIMKRKGPPGIAIMIAMGKPKPEEGKPMGGEMQGKMHGKGEEDTCPECGMKMGKDKSEMHGDNLSKADKVAALEEKIAYLKAELALLQDESSEDSENESEYEDDD